MTAYTQQDLDTFGVATRESGQEHPHISLLQTCHPGKGLRVDYDKRSGTLMIFCHECRSQICEIAVDYGVKPTRQ